MPFACQTSSLPVGRTIVPGPVDLADDQVGQHLAALRLDDHVDAALVVDLELVVLRLLIGHQVGDVQLAQRLERRLGDRLVGGVGDRRGDLVLAAFVLDDGGGAVLGDLEGLDVGDGQLGERDAGGRSRVRPFRAA